MSDRQGFTLVEVLAALVVGGLLLAVLGGVLSDLGRDLHANDHRKDLAQVETIAPMLKGLLESAIPETDSDSITPRHAAFTVAPPQAFDGVGPLRLELDVMRDRTGDMLVASFKSPDATALPPALAERHVLAEGFRRIELAKPDLGGGTVAPVTVMFQPKTGDPVTIVAEPRLSSDANCHFDPISMSCRA